MLTIRILGLTALALLSIVPLVKPTPPTLHSQLFSQAVTLTPWENTVTLGSPNLCPAFLPFTAIVEGMNFTENLSGRDPGSTLVQFRGRPSSLTSYLVKASDLSVAFLTENWCSTEGNLTAGIELLNSVQATMLAASGLWRVPASGDYVLLSEAFYTSTPPPFLVVANETWTVTTLS